MELNVISPNLHQIPDVAPKYQAAEETESVFSTISAGFYGLACITTAFSAVNLADSAARSLLGSCQTPFLLDGEKEVLNACVGLRTNSLGWAKTSLLFFAGSLTFSYLPTVVNKIKNLSVC